MTESCTCVGACTCAPVGAISMHKLVLLCRDPLFDEESSEILYRKINRVAYVQVQKIPVKVIGAIIRNKERLPLYIVSYDDLGIWFDENKTTRGNVFCRNAKNGRTTLFLESKLKNEDGTEWTGFYTRSMEEYDEKWFDDLFGHKPGESWWLQ
jgi:hypothetical protein